MSASDHSVARLAVLDHPLAATQLSLLRSETTAPNDFRRALQRLALLLLLEAARSWETTAVPMESPLASFPGRVFARPTVLVPILRAGLGLQEGMMTLLPEASTGHVGLCRDPKTLRPVKYYCRLPENLAAAEVLLLDPMLATGQSAVEAISIVKAAGAKRLQFLCVLACPPGGSDASARASGCPDHHCGSRSRAEREGIHRARAGRRRRPLFWNGLAFSSGSAIRNEE